MLMARTRNTHLGAWQEAAPVAYEDDPGDATGVVARATDGPLPAWAGVRQK
jgi:hypothetical protein